MAAHGLGAMRLPTTRIVLLSDTHLPALVRQLDELGPECAAWLRGADLILHGGDVTHPAVLDWLESFAPVLAAEGNNDDFRDPRVKPRQYVEVQGWRIGMAHSLAPETRPLPEIAAHRFHEPVEIMIGGHTHLERIRHADGYVLLNSGSPILPHHKETRLGTLAILDLTPDSLRAEIVVLGHTHGRPNPGRPHALSMTRDDLEALRLDGVLEP
jgi:putative phosphoesterase